MSYSNNNISLKRANIDTSAFFAGNLNEFEFRPYANLFYPYIWDNGGSRNIVALTIDVLNKGETDRSLFANSEWIDSNRVRDDLIANEGIWGFVETAHSQKRTKATSNGFCFNGQELTFYIAPMGHSTGYINDQWIYCKTSITISVLNLMDGTQETIKTFSEFDLASSHVDRYFTWQVPEKDESAFVDYGLFGMFVIRLDVQNTYFTDAERRVAVEEDYPSTQSHLLQLLTYSGAQELIDVTDGGVDLLVESISEDFNLEDIFGNTIFDELQEGNDNPLTDSQKRTIIADQIAVLFISQHPVITADHAPSKIVGYGAEESIRAETAITKAITYSRRYPEVIDMVNDRLFGMLANYEHYNYVTEIESLFSNYTQSNQVIRDPSRSILVDSGGIISEKTGIDGVSFNPYIVEGLNTEVASKNKESTLDVQLYYHSVELNDITLSDENGDSLETGDKKIKIAFEVIRGESIITRIRYVLWTKNNLNKMSYIDNTGTSRSHTFDMGVQGSLIWEIDSESSDDQEGEVIFARIDVEDDQGKLSTFFVEQFLPLPNEAPGITYISAFQRQDGSGMVDLEYNYYGVSEINGGYASLSYSTNQSTWIELSDGSLHGDAGSGITPGKRWISWNPLITFPDTEIPNDIWFRLSLRDVNGEINAGVSDAFVTLELEQPEVALRKVTTEEKAAMFDSSTSSESSSSSSSSLGYSSSSSSSTSASSFSSESSSSSFGYSSSSSSFKYSSSSSSSSTSASSLSSSSRSSLGYSSSSSSSLGKSSSSESWLNISSSSSSSSAVSPYSYIGSGFIAYPIFNGGYIELLDIYDNKYYVNENGAKIYWDFAGGAYGWRARYPGEGWYHEVEYIGTPNRLYAMGPANSYGDGVIEPS